MTETQDKSHFSNLFYFGLSFFTLLIGLIAGHFLTLSFSYLFFTTQPQTCEKNCTTNQQTQFIENGAKTQHFFSDDIIIFGEDENKNPFVVKLEFNRKQQPDGSYIHYYFANLIAENTKKNTYREFTKKGESVADKSSSSESFLTSYNNTSFADLSPRETYNFTLQLDEKNLTIFIDQLNGDFLTRNTPLYTKYVSVGEATITIDDKTIHAQAMTSKIYSEDYTKYLFFDGYDTLKSITHYLVLWDKHLNFYLLDTTKTADENHDYKSHTWVLYKNKQNLTTKKAFSANVDFEENQGVPKQWTLSFPDISTDTFFLKPQEFFNAEKDQGTIEGYLKNGEQTTTVKGIFHYGVFN